LNNTDSSPHPPFHPLKKYSTIGIRVGSFSDSLTTRRNILQGKWLTKMVLPQIKLLYSMGTIMLIGKLE